MRKTHFCHLGILSLYDSKPVCGLGWLDNLFESILKGDDAELMKTIHLANIACGFHASYAS